MFTKIAALALVAAGALVSLTGCTAPATGADATAPTVTDVWIRAIPDTAVDGDMTGMFMTVENTSDEDVYLTGGTTDGTFTPDPLDAHEVVEVDGEMVMQDAEGGILIPAHGTTQLMPGGFHIMFWNLTQPIPVGATVTATLTFSNGTSVDVEAVSMTVDMGQEKYVPGSGAEMSH